MIIRDEDELNGEQQSQQDQGMAFQGGEAFSGAGGGGGKGPTTTGNAGIGSPSASANEASGGFVNLEDYLRANSGALSKYGQMANEDVSGLKKENEGVFSSIYGTKPSEQKSVNASQWTDYNDKLSEGEGMVEGWNELDPTRVGPSRTQKQIITPWAPPIFGTTPSFIGAQQPSATYTEPGKPLGPDASDWTNNRGPNSAWYYDPKKVKTDKAGNMSQIKMTADEAASQNADTQALKRYLSEERNKRLKEDYDRNLKAGQGLSYDASLTSDENLANTDATQRAIDEIQSRAKNMQTEDYWTGRMGFDKERGVGNPLDAYFAYQGGGKAAAEQTKGFGGLEDQLRSRLNLRERELANKANVDAAQAEIDKVAGSAAKDITLDELVKERGAIGPMGKEGGGTWMEIQDRLAEENRKKRKNTQQNVWKALM